MLKKKKDQENYDNNNKEHSKMSERNWHWQDAIDAQEHKDYEEIIKFTDILNQDER